MNIRINRKFIFFTAWIALLLILATGCGYLRTARIRKAVTINTFREPGILIKPRSVIAVIPLIHKEEGLSGISSSANEAAAEMLSVKLWNAGFRIIDKIFIKEAILEHKIEFTNYSVNQAVEVGDALGADFVMITSITELEEDTRSVDFLPGQVINTVDTSVLVGLNCKLVDVLGNRVIWSGVATTQDKNLQLSLRRISLQLIYTLQDGKDRPKDRSVPLIGVHY
ncbi:MAG: hypothetical protein AABY87_11095 [bacterium]